MTRSVTSQAGSASPAPAMRMSWSAVPSPNRVGSNFPQGVSCASKTECTAAGYYYSSNGLTGVDRTLVESWNGSRWSLVPTPSPGGGVNFLQGVSCLSVSVCTSVGYYTNSTGVYSTLVESWDGTSWSVVPSPNQGAVPNYLFGVSCSSPAACTAVGYYYNSSNVAMTLIESWDGTRWSVMPTPNREPAALPPGRVLHLGGRLHDCWLLRQQQWRGQDPHRVLGRHQVVRGAQPQPESIPTPWVGCPVLRPPARPWALTPTAVAWPGPSSSPGTAAAGPWCPAPTGESIPTPWVACPVLRRPPAPPWALTPTAAARTGASSSPGTAPGGQWCPAPTGGLSATPSLACPVPRRPPAPPRASTIFPASTVTLPGLSSNGKAAIRGPGLPNPD